MKDGALLISATLIRIRKREKVEFEYLVTVFTITEEHLTCWVGLIILEEGL